MMSPLRAAMLGSEPEDRSGLDLKHLYLEELRRILATKKPRENPRGIRRIIDYTEAHPVAVHRRDGHRTWVWSDLHLRHANIIKYCKRPFANARDMDRTMMTAWKSVVGPDDTVLNGGDVALAGSLGESGRARIREAPGRKILVVGNHDFNRRIGLLDAAGHGVATGILAIDTDPPMVLTHLPMGTLPPGWVNLYGHVHNNEPLRETPHINVCVEHTDYRPLPLESLVTLAKHLLAGYVPEGATTGDRIQNAAGAPATAVTERRAGDAVSETVDA